MFALQIMPPLWYTPAFQWVVCVIMLALIVTCYTGRIYKKETAQSWNVFSQLLVFCLIVVVGLRPLHYAFGDMVNYAGGFRAQEASQQADWIHTFFSFKGEFTFGAIQDFCVQFADLHTMFLIFAVIYFGAQYWACRRLFGIYWFAPFLAMMCMIDYWGFAVNGIRNGAAANLMILALTFRGKPFVALSLGILACGIHKSMMLVVAAALLSLYYKNTKAYLIGWCTCVFWSLLAGKATSEWLASSFLSEADERMSRYMSYTNDASMMQQFSSTGFRFDFLLYSAVPIIVGYWAVYRRSVNDPLYKWWLNVYIISNSFWVLMMYAANSNRFAALSWFTAGIVLSYPFFKYRFSENQPRMVACVLSIWYSFAFYQNILRPIIS